MEAQIEKLAIEMAVFQGVAGCSNFHRLAVKIAEIALTSFKDDLLRRGLEIARAVADFGSELDGD